MLAVVLTYTKTTLKYTSGESLTQGLIVTRTVLHPLFSDPEPAGLWISLIPLHSIQARVLILWNPFSWPLHHAQFRRFPGPFAPSICVPGKVRLGNSGIFKLCLSPRAFPSLKTTLYIFTRGGNPILVILATLIAFSKNLSGSTLPWSSWITPPDSPEYVLTTTSATRMPMVPSLLGTPPRIRRLWTGISRAFEKEQ